MNESIEKEDVNVNKNNKNFTVIRIVHNKENPFVQLNKLALWDKNLSLKAVGLWARCMSRPDNWTFSIKELAKKGKEGRKAIDSAMKELIENGYAIRLEFQERHENGKYKNSGIEYVFFEFPATQEDKEEQEEIFKKSYRNCRYGNFRDGDFRNGDLLIQNINKTDLKDTETPPTPLPDKTAIAGRVCVQSESKAKKNKFKKFTEPVMPIMQIEQISTEAKELFKKFIKILKDHDKNYIIKDELLIHNSLHEMLEIGREADFILQVFLWGIRDNIKRGDWEGWSKLLLGADNPAGYLAVKFQKVASSMNVKLVRKFNASSNQEAPLKILQEMDKRAL